mmetsp:Transcript_6274/g.15125  ORF Transcript_6274/g.15125 Transcript_6274/m.15125 type:complete len:176 (+) Transcript_6274:261-788(+)
MSTVAFLATAASFAQCPTIEGPRERFRVFVVFLRLLRTLQLVFCFSVRGDTTNTTDPHAPPKTTRPKHSYDRNVPGPSRSPNRTPSLLVSSSCCAVGTNDEGKRKTQYSHLAISCTSRNPNEPVVWSTKNPFLSYLSRTGASVVTMVETDLRFQRTERRDTTSSVVFEFRTPCRS